MRFFIKGSSRQCPTRSHVWTSQIIMKKGRPGYTLHVLSKEKDVKRLSNIIFMETTTLGIRKSIVERNTLSRDFVQVETKCGRSYLIIMIRSYTSWAKGPSRATSHIYQATDSSSDFGSTHMQYFTPLKP